MVVVVVHFSIVYFCIGLRYFFHYYCSSVLAVCDLPGAALPDTHKHCRKSAVSIHLWPVIRSSAMMRWTNSLFVSWRMQAIIFVFCCIIFVFISWRNNSACICTILVTSELSVGLENIVIAMATIAVKLRNCENWPQQGHFVVVVVVRWCCALQPSLFNHFLRTECVWYGQAIQHRQCESEVWFN